MKYKYKYPGFKDILWIENTKGALDKPKTKQKKKRKKPQL